MLSQFEGLSVAADGRYATDAELGFIAEYVQSFSLRVQTYLKIQELEPILVQQAFIKLRSLDPASFNPGDAKISAKWRQDTLRVIRYVAITVLINDPDTFQERFLIWFRTVMKAFNAQQSCEMTYRVLQEVVRQNFTPAQASLVCPILELTRRILDPAS